jgi:hypothetical protein
MHVVDFLKRLLGRTHIECIVAFLPDMLLAAGIAQSYVLGRASRVEPEFGGYLHARQALPLLQKRAEEAGMLRAQQCVHVIRHHNISDHARTVAARQQFKLTEYEGFAAIVLEQRDTVVTGKCNEKCVAFDVK